MELTPSRKSISTLILHLSVMIYRVGRGVAMTQLHLSAPAWHRIGRGGGGSVTLSAAFVFGG